MLRFIFLTVTLCTCVFLVGLGVNTSIQQFNRHVLPPEPIKVFSVLEKDNGTVQIELVGETLDVDTAAIQNKYIFYLDMAKQEWEGVKTTTPLLKERVQYIKGVAKEQWEIWLDSEQVRTVNKWVKEKI